MTQTPITLGRVLPDLSEKDQLIQELLAKVARLEAQPARRVTFKVTDKGGVSAYGLGRFPVTLYKSQWEQLISAGEDLQAFLKANASRLTSRQD